MRWNEISTIFPENERSTDEYGQHRYALALIPCVTPVDGYTALSVSRLRLVIPAAEDGGSLAMLQQVAGGGIPDGDRIPGQPGSGLVDVVSERVPTDIADFWVKEDAALAALTGSEERLGSRPSLDMWVDDEFLNLDLPINLPATLMVGREVYGPAVLTLSNPDGETVGMTPNIFTLLDGSLVDIVQDYVRFLESRGVGGAAGPVFAVVDTGTNNTPDGPNDAILNLIAKTEAVEGVAKVEQFANAETDGEIGF